MRRSVSIISVLTLSFFLSALIPQIVNAAEVGTCRKAKNEREENHAPHIFFTIDVGKKLLLELKGLRKDKSHLQLMDTKLKLFKEIEMWYKTQITAAEKTVDRMSKDLVSKKQQLSDANKKLEAANFKVNQLTIDVAKYKGERYQWLMYGIGGTVIVVVLGVIAFGVYSAVSSK